ncbi:MAG TPA: hypothetical protein VK588_12530 [Chitinophagaceae bacterium]|nr:hypothetical protein [Chitinophagaceae bacterium]
MRVILIPDYEEIFWGEKPEMSSLINDIPSKVIISLMSLINSELTFGINDKQSQIKLFQFISQRFGEEDYQKIRQQIEKFYKKTFINGSNSEIAIFGLRYTMELISRELANYRDFEFSDTTPEQELRIFKAYLLVVGELNENDRVIVTKINEKKSINGIKELLWPHYIKQFEFTYRSDPILEGIKSLAFLQFCQRDITLSPCLDTFISKTDAKNSDDYVGKILGIANLSFKPYSETDFSNFQVINLPSKDILFESLTLQSEDISNYEKKQKDYIGIKEKPIFKLNDNNHTVINWNYLYNTLFTGLIFSFYKYSNAVKPLKSFDNYKSRISTEFSHKILFQGIIKGCFPNADCLWFDDKNDDEFNPDCYYRKGKCIFLMEFKDNLINKDIIHSDDFDVIKDEIDKKFISSRDGKKGISQIKRNLDYLTRNPPKFDPIFKKEKIRNYTIYPIIVHTNFYFALPGINEYINERFSVETENLKNSFKPLKPLTIIDIDFFFRHITHLNTNAISLYNIIEMYLKEIIAKKNKSREKLDDAQILFNSMAGFDEIMMRKEREFPEVDRTNYLEEIYRCLRITRPNKNTTK